MPSAYLTWLDGNTMRIELRGLRKYTAVDTTSYLNAATVTATVKDSNGAALIGESWPVTLGYEAGSNGNYSANCASSIVVAPDDLLSVEVTATDSGDVAFWDAPAKVLTRTHQVGGV